MCQPGVTDSRSTCIKATTRGCNKLQCTRGWTVYCAHQWPVPRSEVDHFYAGCLWVGAGVGAPAPNSDQPFRLDNPLLGQPMPAQPRPGRQKSLNYWVSAPARPAQPAQHPPPPLRPVADWIMAPLTIFIPDIELLCSVYKHFIIASFNW